MMNIFRLPFDTRTLAMDFLCLFTPFQCCRQALFNVYIASLIALISLLRISCSSSQPAINGLGKFQALGWPFGTQAIGIEATIENCKPEDSLIGRRVFEARPAITIMTLVNCNLLFLKPPYMKVNSPHEGLMPLIQQPTAILGFIFLGQWR